VPGGRCGTPDGYTKAEADGRFLPSNGKAADAETLDGVGSNGFVQGRGDVALRESLLASGQVNANWFSVAGGAHLQISRPKGVGTVKLVSDSSGDVRAFASSVVDTSANVSEFGLGARLKSVPVLAATGGDSQVTLQVLTGGVAPSATHLTTLVISVLLDVNGGCRFVAHSVHSDSSEPLG
jgi:hypothetical protein